MSLTFSPDGKLLVVAGRGEDVSICDATTGEDLHQILTNGAYSTILTHAAFSPDGTLLVLAFDQTVLLCDPKTGKIRQKWTGHAGPITALAFAPDGKTLATGSTDTTILLWDVAAALQHK